MTDLPHKAVSTQSLSTDSGCESAPQQRPCGASDPTSQAFLYWLSALEAAQVRFACLRGQDSASAERPGSDIDLIVHPEDEEALWQCLVAACDHSGSRKIQDHRVPFARQVLLHARSEGGQHHWLACDVHTAETLYGIPFWDAEEVLMRTRLEPVTRFAWRHSGATPQAPCLREPWAGGLRCLQKLALGGALELGDLAFYRQASPSDRRAWEHSVRPWLGAPMADRLLTALAQQDLAALRALSQPLRRRWLLRSWRRAPLRSTRAFVQTVWARRVTPLFRPRGLCVAFLGTDGSGKTTLIESLQRILQPHFRDGRHIVRKLRPGLLPQINRLFHWRGTRYTAEDCRAPHRARSSGRLGSLLRASWYGLDCVLGWPLRVWPLRRRQGLLIFDRYYHDFLVDPQRARIARRSSAPRWWSRIVPTPDVFLVCVADPERIHARKQELPQVEIQRQVKAYASLAKQHPKMHLVATDGTPEESLDQVLCALFPTPQP